MAVVLAATGVFVYLQLRANLDRAIDQGLRSRAGDISALVQQADTGLRDSAGTASSGPAADFAQIIDADGRVFDATAGLTRQPLLNRGELREALRAATWLKRSSGSSGGPLRLLATPVTAQDRRLVVIIGATLESRDRALADLGTLLLIGGPGALLLSSLAGYGLATAALRPVEAMRGRAASITTRRLAQRLPLGPREDELHRLGQTLNEMLARLETGLARERAFTADASHELRTPLTMLKTELELIARDHPSGAGLEAAVGAAVDEADRLSRLIDDLLILARTDCDQLPLSPQANSVSQLLIATRARRARQDVEILVDAPAGLAVHGDAARLRQALDNMLDNALRHGRGPVRLSAATDGELVELCVEDRGPGFASAFLPHAFERFARADPARAQGGSGLGLAIVRAVAQSHGGDAHVANRPDGRTRVWIAIPAGAGRTPATSRAVPESVAAAAPR